MIVNQEQDQNFSNVKQSFKDQIKINQLLIFFKIEKNFKYKYIEKRYMNLKILQKYIDKIYMNFKMLQN